MLDIVVHMAAETHGIGIKDPHLFIKNNIQSTTTMLDYAHKLPNLETFFTFQPMKSLDPLKQYIVQRMGPP